MVIQATIARDLWGPFWPVPMELSTSTDTEIFQIYFNLKLYRICSFVAFSAKCKGIGHMVHGHFIMYIVTPQAELSGNPRIFFLSLNT